MLFSDLECMNAVLAITTALQSVSYHTHSVSTHFIISSSPWAVNGAVGWSPVHDVQYPQQYCTVHALMVTNVATW